jgi:hypothetical protein
MLSQDSSVGIATCYGLDGRSSVSGRDRIFLFPTASGPGLEPIQPSIQRVPGSLSQEIKRLGREADH